MIALLLIGCAACAGENVAGFPPTATAVRVVQATAQNSAGRDLRAIATASAQTGPEPDGTAESCPPAAGEIPVQHQVDAVISYATRTAQLAHQISIVNQSGQTWSDLGLNIEPNRYPNAFALDRVLVDAQPAPEYELDGRRLTVLLDEPLQPGCRLTLELAYRVTPPPLGEGPAALAGFFSTTPRQMNLGHWLPTLAVRRDGAWVHPVAATVGEQTLAAVADWQLDLRVTDAPDSLTVAAPGDVISLGDQTWRIDLPAARDLSLSLSDRFHLLTRRANGTSIELFALEDGPAAQQSLTTAANALVLFEDLFGDFPFARYVVVEGDFPDGMEHSGLVFVGANWFRGYANDPAGYLTLISAHETAHQWWYALVGNDAAANPWLDEALSAYSEYIFLEEYYPDLREWWWDFRVNTFVGGEGPYRPTDRPVEEFLSVREYINSVYLRGAKMLHAIRETIGSDAFFAWLEAYARNNANRIAAPADLWSLLAPAELAAIEPILSEYLSEPPPAVPNTPPPRDPES